jgi:hypothetical protein
VYGEVELAGPVVSNGVVVAALTCTVIRIVPAIDADRAMSGAVTLAYDTGQVTRFRNRVRHGLSRTPWGQRQWWHEGWLWRTLDEDGVDKWLDKDGTIIRVCRHNRS